LNAALFSLFVVLVSAEEQTKSQPCRPTIACMASFVPAGNIEVESGYQLSQSADAEIEHSMQVLFKVSATNWLQLQVGTNGLFALNQRQTQFGDGVWFQPKFWILSQTDKLIDAGMSFGLGVPTRPNGDGLISSSIDSWVWLYASKDIGKIHVDFNAALLASSVTRIPQFQFLFDLALAFDAGHGFTYASELYLFSNIENGPVSAADLGWLNSIGYSIVPNVVFDIGVDVNLLASTRVINAFAGLTLATGSALW
jgi:hypothetical protein